MQDKQFKSMSCIICNVRLSSMSVRITNDKKRKRNFCGARCYDTFVGAYRECGILPGEEMVREISRTSVIISNSTPSGKQVRECGARVENNALISRSVQISRYISALPQYLERFAARYTNPLRHNNFCKSAPTEKRKWVRGRAKHEQKETGTH